MGGVSGSYLTFINAVDDTHNGGVYIMLRHKENRNDQLNAGEPVRVRGYPKAGIAHPVAKLPSYIKMSVTTEEYKLVIAHRKQRSADLQRVEEFLKARQDAIDVYNNYKP